MDTPTFVGSVREPKTYHNHHHTPKKQQQHTNTLVWPLCVVCVCITDGTGSGMLAFTAPGVGSWEFRYFPRGAYQFNMKSNLLIIGMFTHKILILIFGFLKRPKMQHCRGRELNPGCWNHNPMYYHYTTSAAYNLHFCFLLFFFVLLPLLRHQTSG